MTRSHLTTGQLATLACVIEVAAPKAGNVRPGAAARAAFADADWLDFVASGMAIGPVMDRAVEAGVGATVLAAVRATQAVTGSNTNLGMILLLAPLCAVPPHEAIDTGVAGVLAGLTEVDAPLVYEAIRLAKPGGLGRVAEGDVQQPPTMRLIDAMRSAAPRDGVARQYATDFHEVIAEIAPSLPRLVNDGLSLSDAVVHAHLSLVAHGDTLIGRKCGQATMLEAGERARAVLDADWPHTAASRQAFAQLDQWLRGDGNRRNPGTSADLVTAGLFVALRAGWLGAGQSRKA
ncbi:MAG: triphosphoribosyl-dephospho-CoA synthase [Phycisphaeraceae bacterium]